jgi:multicomponent Na+:H+ antiporter subunit A
MLAVLFAHADAAAVAPLMVATWGRMAFYPLAFVPLGSLSWVVANWPNDQSDDHLLQIDWVPDLSMNVEGVRRQPLSRPHT